MSISRSPASRPSAFRFMSILVSGGRGGECHDVPIVEADDGHVRRHADPALTQGVGRATRDLVVAAKQRVGLWRAPFEEACHSLAAPGFRPDAREVEQVILWKPGGRERRKVAGPAQAHSLEMLGGPVIWAMRLRPRLARCSTASTRAALVVGKQRKRVRLVGLAEDVDHRQTRARRVLSADACRHAAP